MKRGATNNSSTWKMTAKKAGDPRIGTLKVYPKSSTVRVAGNNDKERAPAVYPTVGQDCKKQGCFISPRCCCLRPMHTFADVALRYICVEVRIVSSVARKIGLIV